MKKLLLVVFVLSLSICSLISQNKTIRGRVISDSFETIPEVSILINDTTEVGKTDLNGFFQIVIPVSGEKISFRSLSLEPTTIELADTCDNIEVVMMLRGSNDFISLKRADRIRKKRFKHLPEIHQQAFEKGIFVTEHACYNREFEPFYMKQD